MGCDIKEYVEKFPGILAQHVAFIFTVEYMKSTNLTVYAPSPNWK
jgi:hypothetical protein